MIELSEHTIFSVPFLQHISEEAVLAAVSYEKDVDGFHPLNVGTLAMQGRTPLFVSCTPKGCIELLLRSGVQMKGKRAVVIGRSNIVGTPAAQLLQVFSMFYDMS
jgi:5,10-methylene-tetrahydrofolate dehydrogenase/methenyl tetrahydrofolate cyclohydrolase